MTRQLLAVVDPEVDLGTVRELWVEHGWGVRRGQAPAEPWDLADQALLLERRTPDIRAAADAVIDAVRGASLLVSAPRDPELRAALLRDLSRIGDVVEVHPVTSPLDELDDEQRTLLTAIAGGATTAEAAAAAFLSPRTAERRLAAARRLLGVRTTAEAASQVAGIAFRDVAVIGEYPQLDPAYGQDEHERERASGT